MAKRTTKTKSTQKKNKKVKKQSFTLTPLKSLLMVVLVSCFCVAILIVLNTVKISSNQPTIKLVHAASPSAQINPQTTSTPTPIPSSKPSPTPESITYPTRVYNGKSINIPILYYHYIRVNPNPKDALGYRLSLDPNLFDQELGYLSTNGYTPITLDQWYDALENGATLPSKPIILTFDDGYIDLYTNAFPIISKYQFHVISFIPTGLMDQSYYLRWNMIQEMADSDLVEFEDHTISHADLTTLSNADIQQQITVSRGVLESKINKPVNFFAYPYGDSNARVWAEVEKAGYKAAFGTWGSSLETDQTLFNEPRIEILGGTTLDQFIAKLNLFAK